MDQQVAQQLMQRIAENPVARPLFQRGALLAIQDDPNYVLTLNLSQSGEIGAQLHHATDPAIDEADCRMRFTPEDLASVAQGGPCANPPDISGSDKTLARQVMMLLGISEMSTQHGSGGAGPDTFELARSMVLDAQLGPNRRTFGAFSARDPGPFDCRGWHVEAGVRPQDGVHFAVSVGLTDPGCPIRPKGRYQDPTNLSGLGHELVLLTDASGASGDWHVGIIAAMLREYANSERPFGDPDWIDFDRPLVRGGTCEGFVVTESKVLESPFALDGGRWGRFFVMIGLTRQELDLLNGQKEPRRIVQILTEELGNPEVTDPFRETARLW